MGVNQATRATPRLDLGAAVIEYIDSADAWIGIKALPIFKTNERDATFTAISREGITRTSDLKRAPRGTYNRDDVEAEDKTFRCEEYGLEGLLDDSERRLYQNDFDAELATTLGVERKVLSGQEKRCNDLILNTTTFTGASLYTDISANPWDNVASDIIGQIGAAKELVRANCGMPANALIMGRANLERITLNTAIRTAIQYTAIPTYDQILRALAGLFNLRHILVGDAVRNSADEGQAFTGVDIWNDDYAMVAKVIENPNDLKEPGLGRTFLWVADCAENTVVEQYRAETNRSDVFRVRQHVDEVLLDSNFGHMLKVDA